MPITKSKPTIKKTALKAQTVKPKAERATKPKNDLTVEFYGLDGKAAGNLELPQEVFGGKVNRPLLTQALRVYTNNATAHYSHTKTRAEVSYSTRKLYRQKGTGRARHGSRKAPVFIGAGIALGPRSRKTELKLPKKMKKAALISALSQRLSEKQVLGLTLDKLSGKTAQFKDLVKKLGKKEGLILTSGDNKLIQTVRNIPQFEAVDANSVNVYQIIRHQTLMLTKEAVEALGQRINREKGGSRKVEG